LTVQKDVFSYWNLSRAVERPILAPGKRSVNGFRNSVFYCRPGARFVQPEACSDHSEPELNQNHRAESHDLHALAPVGIGGGLGSHRLACSRPEFGGRTHTTNPQFRNVPKRSKFRVAPKNTTATNTMSFRNARAIAGNAGNTRSE
jgi:hypothetical protein